MINYIMWVDYTIWNICLWQISALRYLSSSNIHSLDSILNFLHNNTIEIIICGDFNINYLNDNDKKSKLDNLLLSYNHYGTVNFPTRIHNNSVSAIDNTFIGKVKYENYSIHPLVNGLSDHDAQIITINNSTVNKRINKVKA